MRTIQLSMALCLLAGLLSCSKKDVDKERDLYFDVRGNTFGRSYYKNYTYVPLNTTESITGSMFVDGDDVYFPTSTGYLKNGTFVSLPGAEVVHSIFVKDGTVYATGQKESYGPAYWKDGQVVELERDSVDYAARALKIIVTDNDDIYIGGTVSDNATALEVVAYWKNNSVHRMELGNFGDMAVSGTDVHIVGSVRKSPVNEGAYWINAVKQYLVGFDGKKPGFMTSVSVWNNDVYLTGWHSGALYWKNGEPHERISMEVFPEGLVINKNQLKVAVNIQLPQSGGMQNIMMLWNEGMPDTLGVGKFEGIYLGN